MSQPHQHDVIRSLDLINQVVADAVKQQDTGGGSCGGDCANCPCSGEAPKSTTHHHANESSDPCDKC
ncbi:MAG: hypothetical protein ACPGYV_09110 [Phycisphaeraceae bacterium]